MSYCCPFINYNDASFGGHYGEETIKEEEDKQDLSMHSMKQKNHPISV